MTRYDPRPGLKHLKAVDKRFIPLIEEFGPPQLSRTRNSFRTLVRAIIYQQITGKAAATVFGRFLALFPGRGFPRPSLVANTSLEDLRSVGLSGLKASYIRNLADAFVHQRIVPRRFGSMTNDEISAVLTTVKGIGQWSADIFLMTALNREDVMPVGDYGVQKGMQRFFRMRKLPTKKQMQTKSKPWAPYRTIGSWYMWRVLELDDLTS